jgi:hypothetical protein
MLGLVKAQVVEGEVGLDNHSIGHLAKSFQCKWTYSSNSFGGAHKMLRRIATVAMLLSGH